MSRLQSPPEAPVRSTSARFVHGAEGGGSARGDIATRTAVPASVARPPSRAEKSAGALVVLGATLVLAYVLTSGRFAHRYTLWPRTQWGNAYWICALAWGGLMYAVLVWRVVLWRRYRPMADVPERRLPSVSVIIPAFNEGPLVCDSIRSAAQSDYPAERLEIIVIDDGSTDDTWANILAAAEMAEHRVRVTTIKQAVNRGKRHALYVGFEKARGSVFVTMDSDSILHPQALRHAVAPLVRDSRIGCVAGCVEVLNPRQSLITRFLKCTFSLSFKFVRAYQSEFRGVFCTPGALSIYRADFVRKVAEEWVSQRFLGRPCVTGEDRAMTNLFLREGWLTVYQGNAVVWSKMPHTYVGACKMFLRWGRSNIRETVFLFRFLFTRFRRPFIHAFRFNMLLTALTLFLPPILIANSIALLATSDGYLHRQIGMVLVYAATVSVIYYINERDRDWVWLFLYEFLWVPAFSWIIPYSLFTLRNTGWLTRGSGVAPTPPKPSSVERTPTPPKSPAPLPSVAMGR